MKRDNDYMRELLLKFEADDSDHFLAVRAFESDEKFLHHVDLLCDAGLVTPLSDSVYRLTYEGHDFIAAIRDPGIWQKVVEKAGGAGIDILIGLAKGFMKEEIVKRTGIDF
ncbi:MAG: DUF2513 domain-containing protein [Paracoccaceae bacterium]|nr:DUF2513 domain-containing protein [Paracoccaceae bacterium]